MPVPTSTPTGRSYAEQQHVSTGTVHGAAAPTDDAEGDRTQQSDDRLTRVDGAKRMPQALGARRAAEPGHAASTSSIFSIELAVRDHAQLAERLADHISQLRQAQLTHDDIAAPRDRLHAFLTDDLIPYLHNEEGTIYARSAGSRGPGSLLGTRGRRRTRRRLRDHSEIIATADAVRSAETTLQALNRAEQVRALLDAHLVAEDRELLAAAHAKPDAGGEASLCGALATELQQILVQDHLRIARAVTRARNSTADAPDQLDACDRATAALAQHAAVMATRAYPMAQRLLPRERTAIRAMREDLRCAERALRHLNRILRGAAGEDSQNREQLWDQVDHAWQRHVADEEPLIRRLSPLLRPEQALSLIAPLRRPAGRSLTRQHPALLHGGWPTRMAIRAQHRIDRWRDILDNRESSRTGS